LLAGTEGEQFWGGTIQVFGDGLVTDLPKFSSNGDELDSASRAGGEFAKDDVGVVFPQLTTGITSPAEDSWRRPTSAATVLDRAVVASVVKMISREAAAFEDRHVVVCRPIRNARVDSSLSVWMPRWTFEQ